MFESTDIPAQPSIPLRAPRPIPPSAPRPIPPRAPRPAQQAPAPAPVLAPEGEPVEFLYQGRRFHIHQTLSRWRESGGWWNRIDDGRRLHHMQQHLEQTIFDDGARAIWRVEAAPVGALATFEIELDELTGSWQIRPTSRPTSGSN